MNRANIRKQAEIPSLFLKAKLFEHVNTTFDRNQTTTSLTTRKTALAVTASGGLESPPVVRLNTDSRPSLFHSVTRRSDTSYVFCTEVQILHAATPPLSNERPKLSLVMPSPVVNPTSPNVTANILQIDCEVLRTRLIDPNS
eukprot:m.220272 g.220272  ORF g.220272 m.220272 type:complete len:142 (+) comp26301_c2_seq5:1089-1514(+)